MFKRHRRLRNSKFIREMVKDVYLEKSDLIYPLFIEEGKSIKKEINSMPGIYRLSIDNLKEELDRVWDSGVRSVLVFGIPTHKDAIGSESYNQKGIIQQGIEYIKSLYPEIIVVYRL